jgi:Homeodomain-like domain
VDLDEEQRRRRAIELLRQGRRPGEVLRELGRSREWLAKWRRRFEEAGAAGLRDVSRAHRTHPASTPAPIVRAVLRARDRLTAHRGRQRFAGSGADAVAWELELAAVAAPPARRTIERILERAGRTRRPAPTAAHEQGGAPYPAARANGPGDLQQTDLVGPRHLRTPAGPVGFFGFHTVDVAGGGVATWQGPDKSAESFCRYLTEVAWIRLGLPLVWQVDNETALAGFPGRPFTQPVRLALLLGVQVRFIPPGEPGRQADIESFNALWQARVLRRFATPSLARLARVSLRFERWFMDERPHPKLSVADHGTRFPGELLAAKDDTLRRMPKGFALDRFRDDAGDLRLPLARGRISWVRRADERGTLLLHRRHLALGSAAASQYVVATLSTARGDITVRLPDGDVKVFRFPIVERVVQRLRPSGA